MNRDCFWLTEDQFSRLAPLLPTDTRGKPRVDDRRVISGIVHVLKSGGRWIDAPDAMVRTRRSTTGSSDGLRRAFGSISSIFWQRQEAPSANPDRQFGGEGASLRIRRQRGEQNQAIGRSRGGRTTKIHALTDSAGRPVAFMLTGGQVADCTAGELLLEQMPQASMLHGDKGYDSNAIRRQVEGKGVMPNIPPKANRRWKNCFSPVLYRNRNAIERMFGRLKDFRRIATRYDRLADNFLAAVCLAATVSYWL